MSFTVEARENEKPDHRLVTALVMGLSVTLMHYTGMFATNFLLAGGTGAGAMDGMAMDDSMLGLIIGIVAIVVLGLSWLVASIDQKKAFDARGLQDSGQSA
jgi:NO-binding membrane sensor protein with MHYT domain